MLDRQQIDSVELARLQTSMYASAAFLAKLAKHLALIACLMIAENQLF
jgi:hypothetical protein